MAGHGIASSSSSHGNTNSHVYDIFLNHRGPDEKKGLASDIYRRLIVRGFSVFLDQPELRKGEDMPSQIKEAIRTASLHLAIFSPTYAQSRWCLDELALMVESGSTIIPVFHNVDPAELRWTRSGDGVHSILRCVCPCLLGEKGRYARDLHMLQKKTTLDPETNMKKPRYDSSTLEKWRNALSVVSYISGFDMNAYDGGYGKLVDEVVEEVCRKVGKTPLNVAKYPTGLDEKIEHLERMVLLQQQTQKSSLQGLPDSVGQLTGLQSFNLRECSSLQRLPDSVGQLTGLQNLDLWGCSSLQGLPESVGNLTRLKCLNLSGCSNLQMLPAGIVEELRHRLGRNFIEESRRQRKH